MHCCEKLRPHEVQRSYLDYEKCCHTIWYNFTDVSKQHVASMFRLKPYDKQVTSKRAGCKYVMGWGRTNTGKLKDFILFATEIWDACTKARDVFAPLLPVLSTQRYGDPQHSQQ
jgi:hypothetical protein